MDKLRIGVIGCGNRVYHLLRRMKQMDPDLSVEAVVEPDPANLKQAQDGLNPDMRVYEDHQALAQDPHIQWVIVGSFNAQHAAHAIACLDAGKDVTCEKPLATTLEDCLAIREAVVRSGRRFALGYTMRYGRVNRTMKDCLVKGMIGKPISVEFNEVLGMNHGGMIHGNWRRLTRNAGTHLLEKCCHDIDCMEWFLQSKAVRVASFGGCNFFTPEHRDQVDRIGPGPDGQTPFSCSPRCRVDPFTADKDIVDNQVVIIEYANQVRATFHINCCASIRERRVYMCGTEGTLRCDRITGKLEVQPIGWDEPQTVWPYLLGEGGHGGADETLCREWLEMMRTDAPPKAGVEEGIASALTCFAIDEAMNTGQVVDLRPKWQELAEVLGEPVAVGA